MTSPLEVARQVMRAQVDGGELIITTADAAGRSVDIGLSEFLERIRQAFNMDVVFVSRFEDGRRVVKFVAADPEDGLAVAPGTTDLLEESYCHHVVEGRLPEAIPDTRDVALAMSLEGTHKAQVGSHLATALVTADGKAYGTICCYSHHAQPHLGYLADLEALKTIAELLSHAIEQATR